MGLHLGSPRRTSPRLEGRLSHHRASPGPWPALAMAEALAAQEAQLRLLSQELKLRKRQLQTAGRVEKRQRRCEEALEPLLLIFMWVALGKVEDALLMFRRSSTNYLVGEASDATLQGRLQDAFWRADMPHILDLMSRPEARLEQARVEAFSLHAQCLTAARVRDLNRTCGLTPSSFTVCCLYENYLAQAPQEVASALARTPKTWVSNRKWVQRWRERWGASFGHFLVNDVEDQATLRAKVAHPPEPPGSCSAPLLHPPGPGLLSRPPGRPRFSSQGGRAGRARGTACVGIGPPPQIVFAS